MFFEEVLKENYRDKKLVLFVDMDGVITFYDVGHPYDFIHKRPLLNNIKVLERISKMENIELHILSICNINSEIKDKNDWLDKYAPFFEKDKRVVLSKEMYPELKSKEIKCDYLSSFDSEGRMIALLDDDNELIKYIKKNLDIVLYQDSILVD